MPRRYRWSILELVAGMALCTGAVWWSQQALAADAPVHDRVVHPDHFYQRFFTAVLPDHSGPERSYLEAALRATEASPFIAFERDVALLRAGD